MNITERAEQFFEWPGEKTDTVTYTSALLFAEHCVQQAARECVEMLIATDQEFDEWDVTWEEALKRIKAHFGLEG